MKGYQFFMILSLVMGSHLMTDTVLMTLQFVTLVLAIIAGIVELKK